MSQNNNILDELKELNSPLVNISRQELYSVPEGYFDELPSLVMLRIKAEETNSASEELSLISPLLKSIPKEMPYGVPQGYFETLNPKQEARVVSFIKTKWFRIAAAAVITGVILLASFLYFGPGANERKAERVFVKLSRDINKMTQSQKENMIEYIDLGLTGKETVQLMNRSYEVKQLLQDIPEEELKLFQEQSEDIEDVLMIN